MGNDYDWVTNPKNNYRYDNKKHWSKVDDFSKKNGDIKYVWEKARFSFLYDLIRYDYHFDIDQSYEVFKQIEDFIIKNPINCGPNYKCSQEISLRVLNWTFALFYYKDSKNLNETLFAKIIHSIYWQINHVFRNINFSLIAVKNNHAISESLLLYLSEKLFPFLPNVKKWSKKGKRWFENEIEYQIYSDGTHLQFSMNYHRVVIQLLTWGIRIAELNNDSFKKNVYDRAEKSLKFLNTCLDLKSGELPNYGSNDGALFFNLTENDFRDYRSQLDDLKSVLCSCTNHNSKSPYWYGISPKNKNPEKICNINCFEKGGYYVIQDGTSKTFIRCGSYKDRPFQSDNLHLDVWIDGKNILRDNGSYSYNNHGYFSNYFTGSKAHNTVSVDGKDQMEKGNRFIWYYWTKFASASLYKAKNNFVFDGKISCFRHIKNGIFHKRKVIKPINKNEWFVEDTVSGIENKKCYQFWHIPLELAKNIIIESFDGNNFKITPKIEKKWHSSYYGHKSLSLRIKFETKSNFFKTKISYVR